VRTNPSTPATPDAPIVICDERGDLYAVQPGIGAHLIDSEDDLDDYDRICAMPMFLSLLRMLEIYGGQRWRRIEFDMCLECGGTGRSPDYRDEPSWEIDEEGRSYLTSDRVYDDCDRCHGHRIVHRWGEEIDRAEVLGKDAA